MNQAIEFVIFDERRVRFNHADAFQLRKDRPALWLQNVCVFVLRKLGAFYIGESVKIERHTLDSRKFIEQLFKQQQNLERFFNRRPTTLLIGSEDYAKLMLEVASLQPFSFMAEYGYGREVLGLKVHVIPWMRGCLVMPDNIE